MTHSDDSEIQQLRNECAALHLINAQTAFSLQGQKNEVRRLKEQAMHFKAVELNLRENVTARAEERLTERQQQAEVLYHRERDHRSEREALYTALVKYGHHSQECQISSEVPCSCGFDAAWQAGR